ncbi:aminomethyl-transferring glycine dehydrogenase subunit GcvPA [Ferroplasma sp.]|uniref:aminomethyl-transferring glycine dehydrogenase subunit GcvPA n=1 Tax=Ferroplasma sp. TaxID=2591003 RepID=UPI00307D4D42
MSETDEILNYLNIKSQDELFNDIPDEMKVSINLGEPLDELSLIQLIEDLGKKNITDNMNFLGNGIYDRFIPPLVDEIIGRNEFLTSYTPYQPEISQGILHSLFEYQSIISDLTEMDVTNSSMYDGFTSLAEAVRMAYRINGKNEVLIPENIYKSQLSIIKNYTAGLNLNLITYGFGSDGFMDLEALKGKITDKTSAILVANPNFFGLIDENAFHVNEIKKDSILITYYDPISLGLIVPPGQYGTDIAVAEGQQLGIHMNYGGPLLGLFSFKKEYVHRSPGRIIGLSKDKQGRKAFVMTLQAREQHIRRARAMSNICSNQALLAVASLAYLSILGSDGLKKIALITMNKSKKLKKELGSNGVKPVFEGINFSDNLFYFDKQDILGKNNVSGGIKLSQLSEYSGYKNSSFFSVTEKTSDKNIEELAKIIGD